MSQSRSDQGCIHMKPASYFRGLNLERAAGVQGGLEHEEKWLVKGWHIPDIPRIVRELAQKIEACILKQD